MRVLLALIAMTSVARAETPTPEHEILAGVTIGSHLPPGVVGFVVAYTPRRWLEIEAGVGGDQGNLNGEQTSLTVRVRTTDPVHVFVGAGESAGSTSRYGGATAVWANLELGIEVDLASSFVRVYGGPRFLEDRGHVCEGPDDPLCEAVPGFGVAFGLRY
jgi:hypothetical protein